MNADNQTLYWLTGLLEGEGSFALVGKSSRRFPQISIGMTDEPIIARVSQLLRVKYYRLEPKKSHWKPIFLVRSRGNPAYELMRMIYPMMGSRRKAKFDEILSQYNPLPNHLGENSSAAKLTDAEVREIKRRLLKKEFARTIAADYGVTIYTIREISQGKVWKHISPDDEEVHISTIPVIPVLPVDYASRHWLAGILEAEGSFLAPFPPSPNRPTISVSMTDEDIIARIAAQFGTKYYRVSPRRDGAKSPYTTVLRGTHAYDLMHELYPLMGARRQAQIDRALEHYTYKPVPRLDNDIVREVKRRLLSGEAMMSIAAWRADCILKPTSSK